MKTDLQGVKTRFLKIKRDLKRVLEIDSTNKNKWNIKKIKDFFNCSWAAGIIAVVDDYPLGFCLYSMNNHGANFFEIKHFVVDKNYHRLGVGTRLINRMKTKINEDRSCVIYDVPDTNTPMHLFLSKMNFKAKLIRKRDQDIYRFIYE